MIIFKPIITMMYRLKYSQKFSFISIIVSIPIILLTLILINDFSMEMGQLKNKQKGVHYHTLLKNLLQDTYQYEKLFVSYIDGNKYLQSAMYLKEKEITLRLQEMEQFHQTEFKDLESKSIIELKKEWGKLIKVVENENLDSLVSSQYTYHQQINELMNEIAEETELFLSDSEHYLFVNSIIHHSPIIIEQLGYVRIIGYRAIQSNRLYEEESSELIFLLSSLHTSLRELSHIGETIIKKNPELKNSIGDILQKTIADTDYFLNDVQLNFIDEYNSSLDQTDFFTSATQAIDDHFNYLEINLLKLRQLLENQQQLIKWKGILVISFIVIALSLTIYSFVGFYFSIRNNMDDIVLTAYTFLYHHLFYPLIKDVNDKYEKTEKKLNEITKSVSFQVLQAQEEERKSVSRELHDGVGQLLYSILMTLERVELEKDHKKKMEHFNMMKELVLKAMNETRSIARSLRPHILDELGFILAIKSFLEDIEKTYELKVKFKLLGSSERLEPEVETALYRVSQEALTNIVKHANASTIYMTIKVTRQQTTLTISDDGIGFNLEQYLRTNQKKGIGLFSMRERIKGVGGKLRIHSNIDRGTTISIVIPKKEL